MSGQARVDESLESFLSSISSNDKKLTEKLLGVLELSKQIQLHETEEARELRALCEALMNEVRELNVRVEDALLERDEYKSLADSLMQVPLADQKLNSFEAAGLRGEGTADRKRREDAWREEKVQLVRHVDNVELSMDKLKLEFSRSLEFYQNHVKKVRLPHQLEATHQRELAQAQEELVKGLLNETVLQCELAALADSVKDLQQKLCLSGKQQSSFDTCKQSRLVTESSRDISDVTDSRLNLVKGFDSLGNKTGADLSCEDLLAEVPRTHQFLDSLDRQADQFLRMSQLFNNDVRSISQNTNHLSTLKCREHAETLLEAGLHLQHTIFQIKKLKRSLPGKLSKTTTMSFLPNNNCLATAEQQLSTNNDSFIKRIQNQSLLRDFSISSLNPNKEDREKKKSACEQINIILKEA